MNILCPFFLGISAEPPLLCITPVTFSYNQVGAFTDIYTNIMKRMADPTIL